MMHDALARAIDSAGPTLPNNEIADAAHQIRKRERDDSCHICIPVVLAEGPLVPMIERLEDLSVDWQDFDAEARESRTFIEISSWRIGQ